MGGDPGGAPLTPEGRPLTAARFPGSPGDREQLRGLLQLPAEQAAPGLLGCHLAAGAIRLRLTEVEAYAGVGTDPASHAHRGRTARNEVMFGPSGHAYVYFTYGMHWCLNVVCGPPGEASAVLLRAAEVEAGLPQVRARRPRLRDRDLARGPARLTRALGVDNQLNGCDLLADTAAVRLLAGDAVASAAIRVGPRVGVVGGADTAWRFWLTGPDGHPEATVSTYRAARRRR